MKKPVILIVDDEARNLRLMEALLTPEGYNIAKAANGREALDRVMETSPDVILMDVMMPVMDGFETTRLLKQDAETRSIPIVMVTALQDIHNRIKALEAGADDFLSKPVDKLELRTRIQTLVKVKAYNDQARNYQKELEATIARKTLQLQQTLEALQVASLESIHRLSRAAEFKDEETSAHTQRMSRYSAALARQLGLDARTVERILYAAPMHDVGKLGIPDRILLKAERLNPDEWEIMKQHTIIGGRILGGSHSGFIRLAEVIALTHHERWDGAGYPRGLKGREIPLVGRIAAIADVFDALTSRRAYKEAFSIEKSFKIIRKRSGTHFDPKVVDALFAIKDEIAAIMQKP